MSVIIANLKWFFDTIKYTIRNFQINTLQCTAQHSTARFGNVFVRLYCILYMHTRSELDTQKAVALQMYTKECILCMCVRVIAHILHVSVCGYGVFGAVVAVLVSLSFRHHVFWG